MPGTMGRHRVDLDAVENGIWRPWRGMEFLLCRQNNAAHREAMARLSLERFKDRHADEKVSESEIQEIARDAMAGTVIKGCRGVLVEGPDGLPAKGDDGKPTGEEVKYSDEWCLSMLQDDRNMAWLAWVERETGSDDIFLERAVGN